MTQVTVAAAADLKKLTEAAPEVKATGFALPAEEAFRESLEGMLLTPQGPVTVTDNYSLNQYGEIGLAGGTTPLEQPTAVAPYGSAEYTATVAANAARGIKLDDGATTNFLKDAAHQGPGTAVPDHGGPRPRGRAGDLQDQRGAQLRQQLLEVPAADPPDPRQRGGSPARQLRRDHPHGRSGGRGRQPQDRLVQRAELLPHHRRPAHRMHVLHGPRRQPDHRPAAAATPAARPTPRTSSASRTRSSPPSPSPAPTSCPSWRSRTRRSSARTATTPWPSWSMP